MKETLSFRREKAVNNNAKNQNTTQGSHILDFYIPIFEFFGFFGGQEKIESIARLVQEFVFPH